jgi:hypothetical protein
MPDAASSLATTNLLIGFGSTGTDGSAGTVSPAKRLLASLDERRVGAALGATRHQLLIDPGGSPTPENLSVCLALRASHRLELAAIVEAVQGCLEAQGVAGSDPGLAIAREAAWDDAAGSSRLIAYGKRAKGEVLDAASAFALAGQVNVHLPGKPDNPGVVGALAAVALHISGSDGVFVWLPDISDLAGVLSYRQLKALAPAIDVALDAGGGEPSPEDVIDLGKDVRPVLMGGRAVLLLDPPMVSTAQAAGFGARPKPVTTWRVSPPDVVNQH